LLFVSQSFAATCRYYESTSYQYYCEIINTSILLGEEDVEILGEHVTGKTDDEVVYLKANRMSTKLKYFPGSFTRKFKNLEFFLLEGNDIQHFATDAFENCDKLEQIWLFSNEITSLPNQLFKNCRNLINLLLNDNQIKSLDENFFEGQTFNQINIVNFGGNLISESSRTLSMHSPS
jgi:Leucine-rich repeat (LRR) protein